jgi:hypothetical protein
VAGFDTSRIFFARFNQFPDLVTATHEEAIRLLEEQRFGGTRVRHGRLTCRLGSWPSLDDLGVPPLSQNAATGEAAYGPGDQPFFIER